jgi:DNA-binding NarL/FixJ family response regulator
MLHEQFRRIRLLLIDDHALFREGLAEALATQADFEIAGQFADVEGAVDLIRQQPVDVVLLDINLGTDQGNLFLNRARSLGFTGIVLVVTAGISERQAQWLLRSGCSGIFLKSEPMTLLFESIRSMMRGAAKSEPSLARHAVSEPQLKKDTARSVLTARESEVLRCICRGLSNKEIARDLNISENTVKVHIQQLFSKTGVRSRAQLVSAAIEVYWNDIDP